jgi:hypothetical protein
MTYATSTRANCRGWVKHSIHYIEKFSMGYSESSLLTLLPTGTGL